MFTYSFGEQAELKLLEVRHAPDLFALIDASREYLSEWLPWVDATRTVDDSKKFIKMAMHQYSQNNGFHAGIWFQGKLAGLIGLHHIDWANQKTSIGYWLGESFQGHGLMTNACRALINYCFDELQLRRVEIRVATGNEKSSAIPKRLGFKEEGCLRQFENLGGNFVDHVVYSLLQNEWQKK